MIAAEFEPALKQRRRSARAPVLLDAKVGYESYDRALCKVTDVSLHGAKIHTYSPMKKGALIWLTLPPIGQVMATVMWADDFVAGCQFRDPLDDAAFALLAGRDAEQI